MNNILKIALFALCLSAVFGCTKPANKEMEYVDTFDRAKTNKVSKSVMTLEIEKALGNLKLDLRTLNNEIENLKRSSSTVKYTLLPEVFLENEGFIQRKKRVAEFLERAISKQRSVLRTIELL